MSAHVPCPCCDLDAMGAGTMMGLALGVLLGASFLDFEAVTRLVCERHEPLWRAAVFMAQLRANAPELAMVAPAVPTTKRTCNKHDDCDVADAAAKEAGRERPYHCHADDCEECFGC